MSELQTPGQGMTFASPRRDVVRHLAAAAVRLLSCDKRRAGAAEAVIRAGT
jgi:hypothetical protein